MTPVGQLLLVLDGQRARVLLSIVLLAVTVAAGVALMATSAWLISTAALHPSIAVLQVAVVGVRFFGISRGIFRYLERVVSHDTTFRLLALLRVRIYRGLVPWLPGRLPQARSGDLLARLVADVDTLEHAFLRVVAPACAALVVVTAVAATLAAFGASIALAATAALVLAATFAPWLGWRLGRVPGEALVACRASLSARIVDHVQGLADLLAFGRAGDHGRDTHVVGEALASAQVQAARASASGGMTVTLLADLGVLAVLASAIPAVRAQHVSGVNLAVVALLTLAAFEAVAALPAAAQGMAAARAAAARVFSIDATPDAGALPWHGVPAAVAAADVARPVVRRVEVRGLTFAYPGERHPVLHDVSFEVSTGGFTAVVGPSGSGKSTIAHLLMRFWDPPAGGVLADGYDILAGDADAWRRHVALMAQDVHLFTGTLADNLRMAWPDATEAAVQAAVRAAGLEELIARLPDGDRTWVGEQGARLSGGERQRLALARAILKPAPVLVIDEATASLDAAAEREILREIDALTAVRAVLLITHRTTGLERAREIVVLHTGRVVERGTYDALMSRGTWFPRMVALERDLAAAGSEAAGGTP